MNLTLPNNLALVSNAHNTSFEIMNPTYYQTELKNIDSSLTKKKLLIRVISLFCLLVDITYTYIFMETAELTSSISSSQNLSNDSIIFWVAAGIIILQGAIILGLLVNLNSQDFKLLSILNNFLLASVLIEVVAIIVGFFVYESITKVLLFSSGWTYSYYVNLGKPVLIFNIVLNVIFPILVYLQARKVHNLLFRLDIMRYGPSALL